MRVVVVASQKGGAGKTTLARTLAVAAEQAGRKVAIADTDPQGSLTSWWNRRPADSPPLVALDPGALPATLATLREAGFDLLVIDTPPSVHAWLADLLRVADLALIPVRPTPDDLDAVGATLDLAEAAGARFAFVLMQVKQRTRLALATLPALAAHGNVAPVMVGDRIAYAATSSAGLTVTEQPDDAKAAAEARDLFAYVESRLGRYPERTAA